MDRVYLIQFTLSNKNYFCINIKVLPIRKIKYEPSTVQEASFSICILKLKSTKVFTVLVSRSLT